MKKRGQTTIFIILAIVIVVGVITTAIIINNKNTESQEYFSQSSIKPQLDSFQSSLSNCAEIVAEDALEAIGLQGGYYNLPDNHYSDNSINIPYYYNQGNYEMPSKQEVENQLALYVDDNVDNCLSELQSDFQITYTSPKTRTLIKEKEVQFQTILPIKITKDKYSITYNLGDAQISKKSELNAIINTASFITDSHKQDPAMYCISCVSELAEKDDLYVDITNFQENEMLIIISENHTSSEPYSFEFLNKYTGEEVSPLTQADDSLAPNPAGV